MSTKEHLASTHSSVTQQKAPTMQPSRVTPPESGGGTNPNPIPTTTPSKIQKGPKTRITVHYDVGFPNSIYIRGEGGPLSWEKGLLLKNVKSDEWIWETTEPFTSCQFKLLINDYDFENGDNHTATCGASVHCTPTFH